MPNVIPSPNMNLQIPVVGVDPGADYAVNVNTSLLTIDGHTHSFGSGVQITPSGLNINTDLSIQQNNVTNLRTVRFFPQSAVIPGLNPDLGCLYEVVNDLYYNDGLGNQVRITESGGVAGSPGSISGLVSPASASYSPGTQTFTWQSGANTAANMDFGSATFRNLTALSNGVTIGPPNALAASYNLTLFTALPGSTSVVTVDPSGNLGTQTYDQIGQNMTSVGANAIEASRTTTVAPTVGIGGVAQSQSCGTFVTSGTSQNPITNFSINITTSGRPVMVGLAPLFETVANNPGYISISDSTSHECLAQFRITNVTAGISFEWIVGINLNSITGAAITYVAPSSIMAIDTTILGVPGTYNYVGEVAVLTSNATVTVGDCQLIAYEL